MSYINCPKCHMKFHENAVTCPRCKITPEQYHQHLEHQHQKKEKAKQARSLYCTTCGIIFDKDRIITITRGSILMELMLWLCFFVPGLIYSLWRVTTKAKGCPACKSTSIIPATSPIAQQALQKV